MCFNLEMKITGKWRHAKLHFKQRKFFFFDFKIEIKWYKNINKKGSSRVFWSKKTW